MHQGAWVTRASTPGNTSGAMLRGQARAGGITDKIQASFSGKSLPQSIYSLAGAKDGYQQDTERFPCTNGAGFRVLADVESMYPILVQ